MPKDVVEKLYAVEQDMAYPARFDMQRYDDPYPDDVLKVAHPLAEAFEIARIHWGEEAGTFTPFASGAHKAVYPKAPKIVIAP